MDEFASTLTAGYDLRGPDFSYIMIDELLDFHHSNLEAITQCKQIVLHLASLLQRFYPDLNSMTETICNRLQFLHDSTTKNSEIDMYHAQVEYFRDAANHTAAQAATIIDLLQSVDSLPERLINLGAFRPVPSPLEIPVKPLYPGRLRTIHAAATKYVYGSEAILSTAETADGQFETYISIRNLVYKYREVPLKTAAAIESITIYESLRYITNVLGYKIIDLNHPTLSTLVSAINKYNADINFLHINISKVTSHTESMLQGYEELQNEVIMASYAADNPPQLQALTSHIFTAVENHRTAVMNLYHEFIESKVRYLSTYIQTEAPIAEPNRWIPIKSSENLQDRAPGPTASLNP